MRPIAAAVLTLGLLFAWCVPAFAQSYTKDDVTTWIDAYSSKYASPQAPFDWLESNSLRVANCESDRFSVDVINNGRLGGHGEVGTFQFMPGPHSIFWQTPSAAEHWDYWDQEANVAAAVYLIAHGFGPTNWSCW